MSKYRSIPTVVNGIRFASRGESRRYQELLLLERARQIEQLALQPQFPLIVSGQKIGTYIADFQYVNPLTGEVIVEDFKGIETPVFKLKKKLVKALYGFDVCCVS